MTRRKTATPKERVLAKWPDAVCFGSWRGGARYWTVEYAFGGGSFKSPALAWADAAKRLRGKR